MGIAITLKEYLAGHKIDCSEFLHRETGSSLETASAANIPSKFLAKAVLLSDGKNYLLAALDGINSKGGDHKTLVWVRFDDFRELMKESDHTEISQPM